MNIKQFSEKTGLTQRAIRLYEEKGIIKPTRLSENKYRSFNAHDVAVARKIAEFRQLGFSLNEIVKMLAASPTLTTKAVAGNIQENLKRLLSERESLDVKIRQTEILLDATENESELTKQQKMQFQNMAYAGLSDWSLTYLNSCLKKKSNGPDEQLQMAACAYADLVLKVSMGEGYAGIAKSHRLIAKTLKRIKEPNLGERHEKLALAYDNLAKDPHYYDLPG